MSISDGTFRDASQKLTVWGRLNAETMGRWVLESIGRKVGTFGSIIYEGTGSGPQTPLCYGE